SRPSPQSFIPDPGAARESIASTMGIALKPSKNDQYYLNINRKHTSSSHQGINLSKRVIQKDLRGL
ncbi:hypothetical protein CEXT_423961, partial [Caerostris extrusa]